MPGVYGLVLGGQHPKPGQDTRRPEADPQKSKKDRLTHYQALQPLSAGRHVERTLEPEQILFAETARNNESAANRELWLARRFSLPVTPHYMH